ncbi:peptidoglycan editing factor PgeF [Humisphaera borealis]|uniref:Purine nucleoside phosphorylase n=1 Tax=Humisphaera borealis TaxID=2807512 RepID=A0A7M2WZ86_9BACT|nr:peptidoglycan editing factor PgeF [Humisphaera borealis]QOV90818.1 peptidoglycan editing factor PgeF [Humisphaera borealis]
MLERITATDGVVFYRSERLFRIGTPHGFSTRIGGQSSGPFASLNLGNPNGCPVQDDVANIAENYRRLQSAIGAADRRRVYVHQVHGDHVETADDALAFDCNLKADAIVTSDSAAVAAVRVADCVPVLLASVDGRTVAAVHAGWRGVVAGIVLRAVEKLRNSESLASASTPIAAAIGPSISFDNFEVGPEVVRAFEDTFAGDAARIVRPVGGQGKALIDLRTALKIQLKSAGIDESSIDVSDRCTYRDVAEFFSHRRDNGVTGRMAALIGAA